MEESLIFSSAMYIILENWSDICQKQQAADVNHHYVTHSHFWWLQKDKTRMTALVHSYMNGTWSTCNWGERQRIKWRKKGHKDSFKICVHSLIVWHFISQTPITLSPSTIVAGMKVKQKNIIEVESSDLFIQNNTILNLRSSDYRHKNKTGSAEFISRPLWRK